MIKKPRNDFEKLLVLFRVDQMQWLRNYYARTKQKMGVSVKQALDDYIIKMDRRKTK